MFTSELLNCQRVERLMKMDAVHGTSLQNGDIHRYLTMESDVGYGNISPLRLIAGNASTGDDDHDDDY